jgi:serum/glucocorticoid-regulated kinase 2
MSPEMLSGERYSFAIDFYSLGALLFEMLTGLPPHYSADTKEMFTNKLTQDLYYPREFISPEC